MILFITRTWHGTGGLQTLSHDLWEQIHAEYGDDAELCLPAFGGFLGLVVFAVEAMIRGTIAGRRGAHLHLGDASLSPLGALLHRLTGATVTATVAGLDVVYPAWWYQLLLQRSLRHLAMICPNSQATAEELLKRGVQAACITVIPCGIPTAGVPCRSTTKTEPLHLLSICRLVPRKGIAWFTREVFPQLLEHYPSLHYTIVGDGPEKRTIEAIIRERGLGAQVTIIPPFDIRAQDDLLLQADCLVVPNIPTKGTMEGFGIVCIEAAARGVQVAAAKIEGLQDAVRDGETGRFFAAGNPDSAIACLQQMLDAPLDPAHVAAGARQYYDWSVLFPIYRDTVFR